VTSLTLAVEAPVAEIIATLRGRSRKMSGCWSSGSSGGGSLTCVAWPRFYGPEPWRSPVGPEAMVPMPGQNRGQATQVSDPPPELPLDQTRSFSGTARKGCDNSATGARRPGERRSPGHAPRCALGGVN